MKEVQDVKRIEELEDLASELSALKKDKCDEHKNQFDDVCKALGEASVACDNAVLDSYVDAKVEKCKKNYQNAAAKVHLYLGKPTDVDEEIEEIDFAELIREKQYEDDFEDPEYDEKTAEYYDDFEEDIPPEGYSIELVKGKHANNNDYFKRLTPSKLEGLIQLDQLKIEGDNATLGPFLTEDDREKAMSELFDNEKYHKLPNGKWSVNNKTVSETSYDHWFLKMKRVSVVDKTTESVLARATRQGGKTRNRRHRRKSAKSSSKRIPRVVTKKHRRNRKTRKGKRKEKK